LAEKQKGASKAGVFAMPRARYAGYQAFLRERERAPAGQARV
jgi:hypothetical protein